MERSHTCTVVSRADERKRFIVARFRSGENRDETVKLHVWIDLSPGLPRHIWKMDPMCFCFGKTFIYLLNIYFFKIFLLTQLKFPFPRWQSEFFDPLMHL